jgi:hypothetical protein
MDLPTEHDTLPADPLLQAFPFLLSNIYYVGILFIYCQIMFLADD